MADLRITITQAGYDAIANKEKDGIRAMRIGAVALGSGTAEISRATGSLENEVVRLDTIAGEAVDKNTLHVMIKDESRQAYTVREFALITDAGVMFAAYSQPGVIIEKASDSTLLLAIDIAIDDLDATQITFGDASFTNPPASESVQGVVELATSDESRKRKNKMRVLTPASGGAMLTDHEKASTAHDAAQITVSGMGSFGNHSTVLAALRALGAAAGRDVGTRQGELIEVGGFGLGGAGVELSGSDDLFDLPPHNAFYCVMGTDPANYPPGAHRYAEIVYLSRGDERNCALLLLDSNGDLYHTACSSGTWRTWQKSVSTERAIRAGDGLAGGGDLSSDREIKVDKTVVRTGRGVNAGDGLDGGGDLSGDRTLEVDSTVIRTNRNSQTINGVLRLSKNLGDGNQLVGFDAHRNFSISRKGSDITTAAMALVAESGGNPWAVYYKNDPIINFGAGGPVDLAKNLHAHRGVTFGGGSREVDGSVYYRASDNNLRARLATRWYSILTDRDKGTRSDGKLITVEDELGLGSTAARDPSGSIDDLTRTAINVRSSSGALIHLERSGTPSAFQIKLESNADPRMLIRRRNNGEWTDNERVLTDQNPMRAYQNVVVFKNDERFKVPDELKNGRHKARVRLIAGGGGGAKDDYGAGAGGAEGGEALGLIDLTGVDSVPVRVGKGGPGGSLNGGSINGENGGTSSFGSYMSATGGSGGYVSSGSTGGNATGGDVNRSGAPGGVGMVIDGKRYNGAGGGRGGGRPTSNNENANIAGNAGSSPGAGGAGGVGTGVGGSGHDGEVVLEW